MDFGIKLIYSLKVMLVGMLIVFVGLVILIACVEIMARLMNKSKAEKKAAPAPAPAPAPVAVPQAAMEEVEEGDEAELIAAITAALTMYCEDGTKLAVRQVRKVTRHENPWARAGRLEALDNRF